MVKNTQVAYKNCVCKNFSDKELLENIDYLNIFALERNGNINEKTLKSLKVLMSLNRYLSVVGVRINNEKFFKLIKRAVR